MTTSSENLTALEGGYKLFVETRGRGPAVLLSDGLLCDGHAWKYLAPSLESMCEVVHFHYPGHGQSADPPPGFKGAPQELAELGFGVLERLGIAEVVVIGHSLGVQVALEMWRQRPDVVRGLVLLCGSPGNVVADFHKNRVLSYLLPLLSAAGRFVPRAVTKLWQRSSPEQLLWLAVHSKEVNPRLLNASDLMQYLTRLRRVDWQLALNMMTQAGNYDASPFLSRIQVPTLILAGQNDTFTPVERSEFMAVQIPRAELLLVPAGTHSLPIELPELVNLRIRRFLSDYGLIHHSDVSPRSEVK